MYCKVLLVPVLVLLCALCGGCLVISGNKGGNAVVASEPQDPAIAEINAVRHLAFDNHRHDRLREIAQRASLSPAAQVRVVDAACELLAFDNHRLDVMLTLARNETLTPAGRQRLLDRVASLNFEPHRRQLLDEVARAQQARQAPATNAEACH